MGKNKALAHLTSTYFHTRRVFIFRIGLLFVFAEAWEGVAAGTDGIDGILMSSPIIAAAQCNSLHATALAQLQGTALYYCSLQ